MLINQIYRKIQYDNIVMTARYVIKVVREHNRLAGKLLAPRILDKSPHHACSPVRYRDVSLGFVLV